MRLVYFSVATLWGFLIGTGLIRAVLPTAESGWERLAWVLAAAGVALLGAFVASR